MNQTEQYKNEELDDMLTNENIIDIAKSLDDIKHGRESTHDDVMKRAGLR